MKAVSPFVALLLLGMVPLTYQVPLRAESDNCVPLDGCSEGQVPPDDCCEPPPCEFQQQLKFARAYRDQLKDIAIGLSMVQDTSATLENGGNPWSPQAYEAMMDLLKQASPCPDNSPSKRPPIMTVEEENHCEIMYPFEDGERSASLEELNDNFDTCAEIIAAKYRKAEVRREICLVERYRTNPKTLHEQMQQDLAEAEAELETLENFQKYYEDVCSVAPDSQAAQEAVDDDLAPLLPENNEDELAPLTPDPPKAKKKKNKRTGKKAGRR